jgi:hypothetical protein
MRIDSGSGAQVDSETRDVGYPRTVGCRPHIELKEYTRTMIPRSKSSSSIPRYSKVTPFNCNVLTPSRHRQLKLSMYLCPQSHTANQHCKPNSMVVIRYLLQFSRAQSVGKTNVS